MVIGDVLIAALTKSILDMTAFFQRLLFISASLVLGGVVLLSVPTASAQSSATIHNQQNQGSTSTGLPDWAEPSDPHALQPSDTKRQGGISPDGPVTHAPDPGDDPSRVPVDGGLSLLALAGAGYAVRKLRQEPSHEE